MGALELKLSEASGVPYYRQIVDQIGQLIRSGRLVSADQLPSVRELAASLAVSLITTRRAYADLEAGGLIVRRQGHGTFVAEEIKLASHEQALSATRNRLVEAVAEARRLGLEIDEIARLFASSLEEEENHEHI